MKRFIIGIVVLLLALLVFGSILAQVSPHFDLGWHLLSGGGGPRSSASYRIDDALGQWPDGSAGSAHYRIDPGFFPARRMAKTWHLYLPINLSAEPG